MADERRRERAQRVDAGEVRRTQRDAELLEWMAHMYGIPLDLLQHGLDVSQVRAYQLVQRWKRARWVSSAKADAGPTWVYPTRATATSYLGWDADWIPRATTTGHVRAVAALRLYRTGFALDRWISERTLRHEGGGWRRKSQVEPHVPDGIEVLADGSRVLIEVELTVKSPERMYQVIQDVRARASELDCAAVAYWCPPRVAPTVQRAIERYRTEWSGPAHQVNWHVQNIEEVPGWTVQKGQQS